MLDAPNFTKFQFKLSSLEEDLEFGMMIPPV